MTRCPSCPGHTNRSICHPIPGHGPLPCRVMFIGEGPSYGEVKSHRPFAGPTGKELDGLYLPLAGLSRPDVYVTNGVKCNFTTKFDNPPPSLATTCSSHHLPFEIRQANPEVIVALGAVAGQGVFGLRDLDIHHGIPIYNYHYPPANWTGTLVPLYHPAGGLYETRAMIQLRDDFQRLGNILDGHDMRPVDRWPDPHYEIIETVSRLDEVFNGILLPTQRSLLGVGLNQPMGVDTEDDSRGRPFCLSFSHQPGFGYIIMADNPRVLRAFQSRMTAHQCPYVLHYATHDITRLQRMSVWTMDSNNWPPYVDTMMRAFIRCNLPQGLKALAYRECGMVMEDFMDVVGPHADRVMWDWLEALADPMGGGYANPNYKRDKPTKLYPDAWRNPYGQDLMSSSLSKRQPIDRKVARILGDREKTLAKILAGGKGEVTDLFNRWWKLPVEDRRFAERVMGEMAPGRGIEHVPREKFTWYAARDADATIRLYWESEKWVKELIA